MNLSPNDKIAGVLTPLFALRTEDDLGIGDLEGLRQFIEWSRRIGFRLIQLLPINETGGDSSPYNAISSRALDPTTLHLAPGSPADLSAEAFAETVRGIDLAALRRGGVDYEIVKPLKKKLLERAFSDFLKRSPDESFAAFCALENAWLDDYTLFRVLMEINGEREIWDEWPQGNIALARAWLDSLGSEDRRRLRAASAILPLRPVGCPPAMAGDQVICHRTRSRTDGRHSLSGSAITARMSLPVRPDSISIGPAALRPSRILKTTPLPKSGGRTGAFRSTTGTKCAGINFDWWRQRVDGVKGIFHLFRIDHVLGFYRVYAFPWRPRRNDEFLPLGWDEMRARTGGREPQFVPRDDRTWENCVANQLEGEEYLRVVLDESGETRVVGEDLGMVPDYVRPSLRSLGIAGFKIPQWENYPDQRSIPGYAYERISVATFATHDHKPLRALWEEAFWEKSEESEQAHRDLTKIAEFAACPPPNESTDYLREFYPVIFDALFRSESWIAVVMITDLLGRKDRFNVPGMAMDSNWTRRLHTTVAKLGGGRALRRQLELVHALLEKSGRLSSSSSAAMK